MKIGDVVRIKGQTVRLTVEKAPGDTVNLRGQMLPQVLDQNHVGCIWFNSHGQIEKKILHIDLIIQIGGQQP